MIDKDAEIACEYVVPPAVGYDRSHGHLVNLYNAFIVIYNK